MPVGSTFAAVGANSFGIILKPVRDINSGIESNGPDSDIVDPRVIDIAFREVDQLIK